MAQNTVLCRAVQPVQGMLLDLSTSSLTSEAGSVGEEGVALLLETVLLRGMGII